MAQIPTGLTLFDLVCAFRQQVDDLSGDVDDANAWESDDTNLLWTNQEATRYANEAQWEFATRRPIQDSITADIVEIPVLADVHTYAYDNRILNIRRAMLDYGNLVLNPNFDDTTTWTLGTGWSIASGVASCDGTQTADSDLEQSVATVVGTDYDVTFTISNYSAGTLTPLLGTAAGTARSANGTYTETITQAGALTLFLRANDSFVGDVDVVKVIQNGTLNVEDLKKTTTAEQDRERFRWRTKTATLRPMEYIEDADEHRIRLIDIPTVPYILRLEVGRLPLKEMVWNDRLDDKPEIHWRHHLDLVDWMEHLAYKKRDSQTFNPQAAELAAQRFADRVGPPVNAFEENVRRRESNLKRRVQAHYF